MPVPAKILAATRRGLPPLPRVDAVRRKHVRRPANFRVTLRPPGVEALVAFGTRDISEGGTFVVCDRLLPVGSMVDLRLVHPETGAAFLIPGQVVRTIDALDPKEKGMGIQFDLAGLDLGAWMTFLALAPVRQPEVEAVPESHRRRFRALQRRRD